MKKLLTGNEAVAEGIIELGQKWSVDIRGLLLKEVVLILLPQKEELGGS